MKRMISCVLVILLLGAVGLASPAFAEDEEQTVSEGGNFIFVCPIVENVYWKACAEGIQRADAELGTTTQIIGPATADNFAEEIIGYMEQAIEARPDGIMVYAGVDGMVPLINQAVEEGIPVISIDNDAPDSERVAYVGTNSYDLGYQSGEALVDLTGSGAKIGYICSAFSLQGEQQVYNAFLDAVHDYDIEVVATAEGNSEPDYAAQAARDMLTEHPELDAIYCTGGYNVTGAAKVKEEMGLDDLVLVGCEDVEENLEYVRKGVIDVLMAQTPEQMGYRGVYLLKECVDDGGLSLDAYNTEILTITQENVDSYADAEQAAEGSGKTVRVGYYMGDSNFQDGFSDEERKSGYAYEYYMAIAALTGWRYEYVYGTRQECVNLLIDGDVDVVAGLYRTGAMDKYLYYSKYDLGLAGEARYFAVNRGREDLLKELDDAMEEIQMYSPNLPTNLYQKYYSQNTWEQVLSDVERAWLAEKGVLRMGYVRENLPLSGQDENGDPIGVAAVLLKEFTSYLHVEMEPVCYDTLSQMEEGLNSGEIDMAFPSYSDLWLNETKGFAQTDSFLSERTAIVYEGVYTDAGDLLDSVALSRTGEWQQSYLEQYYPDAEPVYYDTREDVFEAIQNGKVQCTIGCSSIIQWFMSANRQYEDMNVAYLPTSEEFGIAVEQSESRLVGILNKAVRQMDDASITSAMVYYSNVYTEPTLVDFLRQYVVLVIGVFAAFFAILVWVFLAYRKKSIEFNREQAKTQAQLQQALEDAEKASRYKTSFLSSMSHDIRTPMNAIVGLTSIASKHLDERDRVEDCLEKISLSSHHLLTLINDVLDISKIESGRLTLSPVSFSLRDTVASLVNIIRPQAKEKNLIFEVHLHGIKHEVIFADEVRVNQIFVNILSNAVKYTPDGGQVTMDLAQEILPDGGHVRLTYTVADTGIGMSEEFMENMYDTFSRAQDSRINKIQGTGLGLSIVKQMVTLMGGTIQCKSKEGEGTTFVVTLEVPLGEQHSEKPKLPGAHILIVDDDEIFLETAKETLLDMDAQPETVQSGEEALELLKRRHDEGNGFQVAIVDWRMPEMNGMETVKAIQDAVDVRIPTILVSAYDLSDIEDEVEGSGANGFISKPLFPSYIYEKISEVLADRDKHIVEEMPPELEFMGMNVLVAEDNDLNWEVLSEMLNMYGITSQHAENGQVCLKMLEEAPEGTYELVLMDVQMPVMNGKDATRAIRASQIPYVRDIPVVAMTADAFAEDIAACLEAGMNGHVAKPVDMDKFFQEIRKVLGG